MPPNNYHNGPELPAATLGGYRRILGDTMGASHLRETADDLVGKQPVCWLAIALACGIAVYFALPNEPPLWPTLMLVAGLTAGVWLARRRHALFCAALVLTFGAIGFVAGQLETALHDTRMMAREVGPSTMTGRVVATEPLRTGSRLLVDQVDITGLEPFDAPSRVRISARSRDAEVIKVGDWITATVSLAPPSGPVVPGGFDFRRHAYFEGYGATGFSFGSPDIVRPFDTSNEHGINTWSRMLDSLRSDLARDVMRVLPGETGAVAAALLTGHRRAIGGETADNMRDAGLAHLLAISGLHIGLVAGIVFFAVRGACALVPGLALYQPIKKWAALTAILFAFSYMMLAGASVPTQRAFIMTAFVMLAIMIDRRAITLRLVAWAAIVVLLVAPHSLVEPGFQMSFAAVAALVGCYEKLTPWFIRRFPPTAGIMRRLGGYLVSVGVSTMVAGLATMPFALFHFGQAALYGLPANLIAVPLTGLWILPSGLLTMIATPLNLADAILPIMGAGIDLLLMTASEVSAWPGATTRLGALPDAFPVLACAGGLVVLLSRRHVRLVGVSLIASAVLVLATHQPPSIIVAETGRLIAMQAPEAVRIIEPSQPVGAFKRDLVRRAMGEQAVDAPLADPGFLCDSLGCRWSGQGHSVAVLWHEGALIDDCWDTDIVIATFPLHGRCAAARQTIDVFDLWRNGSLSVDIGDEVSLSHAEAEYGYRPWHRKPPRH